MIILGIMKWNMNGNARMKRNRGEKKNVKM